MALFDYTPDPMGSLMGTYYDPKVEQQRKISGMLSAMGQALLNPDPHSKLGTLGTIGNVAAAAGQGAQKAGTDYLAKAYAQTRAAEQLRQDQVKKDQDAARAEYVAKHPELGDFIKAYPAEAGDYIEKQMLAEQGIGTPGNQDRASTTPTKVFNPETNQWEDWQLHSKGGATKVEYGKGGRAAGPGEASVQGAQFKDYAKQQDAAYTSVTNIAQASGAISDIRQELSTDPAWKTSWGGVALKDLPGTAAMGLRKRIEQLDALAFFSNIQEMQGYGALSNAEGNRVAVARSRVDQATDLPTLQTALDDYEKVLNGIYERNQKIIATGDWEELNKQRQENAKGLNFKKSRVPPFPTDGSISQEDWDLMNADEKRAYYDAGGMTY